MAIITVATMATDKNKKPINKHRKTHVNYTDPLNSPKTKTRLRFDLHLNAIERAKTI